MKTTLTIEDVKRFDCDYTAATRDVLLREGIATIMSPDDAEARKFIRTGFSEVVRLNDGAATCAVDAIDHAKPLKWTCDSQIEVEVPELDDVLRLPDELEELTKAAKKYDPAAYDELIHLEKDANNIRPIFFAIDNLSEDFRGDNAIETCREWRIRFEDSEDSVKWIKAGFWCPIISRELADYGITPDDAKKRAAQIYGSDEYRDKFGRSPPSHELCCRDLSMDRFTEKS